jgi:hypothetical protein
MPSRDRYLAWGFSLASESLQRALLYYPLTQPSVEATPLEPRVRPHRQVPVEILILAGYLCPFEVSTLVTLREVALEFGDQVVVREVPLTPDTLVEYGTSGGIFINGQPRLTGGETEESIRRAIMEEL